MFTKYYTIIKHELNCKRKEIENTNFNYVSHIRIMSDTCEIDMRLLNTRKDEHMKSEYNLRSHHNNFPCKI